MLCVLLPPTFFAGLGSIITSFLAIISAAFQFASRAITLCSPARPNHTLQPTEAGVGGLSCNPHPLSPASVGDLGGVRPCYVPPVKSGLHLPLLFSSLGCWAAYFALLYYWHQLVASHPAAEHGEVSGPVLFFLPRLLWAASLFSIAFLLVRALAFRRTPSSSDRRA